MQSAISTYAASRTLRRGFTLCLVLLALFMTSLTGIGCGFDPDKDSPTPEPPTPTAIPTPTPPPTPPPPTATPEPCTDSDEDGSCVEDDCDDRDDRSYPGAKEQCDGKDNNCDSTVPADEADEDKDGERICAGDCNDQDDTIGKTSPEICDQKDNNCDGSTPTSETADSDGDGFKNCEEEDCLDAAFNPDIYPDAPEKCDGADNNCDGITDEGFDLDDDTYYQCSVENRPIDCNDQNDAISPAATEVCDSANVDEDCDTLADDADSGTAGTITWYQDADGDGYGNPASTLKFCDAQSGFVSNNTDCNDTTDTISPVATEICDFKDNDCNSQIDETFDQDKDGVSSCGGDCNDTVATIKPGATEQCNGVDDDCSGAVEATEVDTDGDSFLDCQETKSDCKSDPSRNPSAQEVCDGKDNNCDGATDEGYPDGVADTDGDGLRNCLDSCPRWVDGDETAPSPTGSWDDAYRSIQQAIDALDTTSCGYVVVRPGTYVETINFSGKNFRLIGSNLDTPAQPVILDGGEQGPVVTFDQNETRTATLQGFTIRHGTGFDGTPSGSDALDINHCGGGVRILGASPTLSNNVIELNEGSSGAGVCIVGGAPLIGSKNIIQDNTATLGGGGLLLDGGTSAQLYSLDNDISISGNSALMGAGVYCGNFVKGSTDGAIREVTITENSTLPGGQGGGIYITSDCSGELRPKEVTKNSADKGGGLFVKSGTSSTVTLSFKMILNLNTANYGGGMYVQGSGGVLMEKPDIQTNTALIGGGIMVESSSAATLRMPLVSSNVATQNGGGLYASTSSKLIVEDGTISANKADQYGGGLYALGAVLTLSIKSGTAFEVKGNTARVDGGGLYFRDLTNASTITSLTLDSNTAANGGGVLSENSVPIFQRNTVKNNQASSSGGIDGVLCIGTPAMKVSGTALNVFVNDSSKDCQ